MQTDTPNQLSPTTIALHWLVAIMMIGLLATGLYMEQNEIYALYPWHKSFGVLIAFLVILRILWRIKNGWPTPVSDYTAIERLLSKIVHYLLLIGTVLMPISGFMMSAMGGHGVDFFGIELVARNPDPADPQQIIPLNGALAQIGHVVHGLAGYTLIAAVALHMIGAFKHHIIDKDRTLLRMISFK